MRASERPDGGALLRVLPHLSPEKWFVSCWLQQVRDGYNYDRQFSLLLYVIFPIHPL